MVTKRKQRALCRQSAGGPAHLILRGRGGRNSGQFSLLLIMLQTKLWLAGPFRGPEVISNDFNKELHQTHPNDWVE